MGITFPIWGINSLILHHFMIEYPPVTAAILTVTAAKRDLSEQSLVAVLKVGSEIVTKVN